MDERSVIRNFRITAADGKNYDTQHYSLDAIISVGYRVNSLRVTQFRQWATRHDDGVGYGYWDYLEQLTYRFFLKMASNPGLIGATCRKAMT